MYLKTIWVINSRSVKVTSYMSIFQVPCLFEVELLHCATARNSSYAGAFYLALYSCLLPTLATSSQFPSNFNPTSQFPFRSPRQLPRRPEHVVHQPCLLHDPTSACRHRIFFHSSLAYLLICLCELWIFLENSTRPFFRVAMGFGAIWGEIFVY